MKGCLACLLSFCNLVLPLAFLRLSVFMDHPFWEQMGSG